MSHFDVFNGDADGLCALHQLRLAQPREAQIVTGVKRDNALLARVPARAGDSITALDIAMAGNREALVALLESGVSVEYFDHHHAGDIPSHPGLKAVIDPAPDICTSVLVDAHLGGARTPWAIVGAYGDNLRETAGRLADRSGLDRDQRDTLRRLGECLNYNSYGDGRDDLMYWPADLYRILHAYEDPFEFVCAEEVYARLEQQRTEDMNNALAIFAELDSDRAAVYVLHDEAWARRVVGSLANNLVKANAAKAYAILVPNARGNLTVSLRVPAGFPGGADAFARRFGGDGRRTAAGINDLPGGEQARFQDAFMAFFSGRGQ
jgi:hypothetical protein